MKDSMNAGDYQSAELTDNRKELEHCRALWKEFSNADERSVYIKDENLEYIFCNKTMSKRFGKTPEEIRGLTDFDLTDRETAESRRRSDRTVIEQSSVVTYEMSLSGSVYQVTKFPLKMFSGKFGVGGYIQNVTDIRRHKKRQEQIIHRHQILADVLTRSFSSRQEHLDFVLNEAVTMTESEYGYLYFYDEEKRQFTLNSWSKGVMDVCLVVDPPKNYDLEKTGIWGEVVRQRKPIIVHDLCEPNPLKKGFPEGHIQLNSFMSIPVIIDGRIVAVTGLANKKGDYNDEDIADVTTLMSGAWNAIERRVSQEKLVFERNKYMLTLFSIGDGVMVVDRDGRIEMLNHVAVELTGWPLEEASGRYYKEVFRLTHETKGTGFLDPIERVLLSDTIQEMEDTMVLTSKTGTKHILEDSAAPIMDERGVTLGVVLVFRDITDKVDQRKKIEYLSYHDYLTGLYNRMFFEEEMRRLDTERNLPISIIMGDLNGLKLTNDFFGHSYGDMLLKTAAEVLSRICREDDIIARWGGDEFVILLPKTSLQDARQILVRIKSEFSKERIKSIRCSISLGVDSKQNVEESLTQVLDRAEEKMYLSKTLDRTELRSEATKTIIDNLHRHFPREKEHSEIVSRLSEKLGRKLGLTRDEQRKLREAGFFHDIGKVVLDSALVENNNLLTPGEISERQNHPIIGYRILNTFDDTMDLAETVLAHEENWDGTGYPKCLAGEDIPLLSRIIKVAERYERELNGERDEPSDNRTELVLQYIREYAGRLFDPRVANAFIEMMENGDVDQSEAASTE